MDNLLAILKMLQIFILVMISHLYWILDIMHAKAVGRNLRISQVNI
jgi:hypothetical protein